MQGFDLDQVLDSRTANPVEQSENALSIQLHVNTILEDKSSKTPSKMIDAMILPSFDESTLTASPGAKYPIDPRPKTNPATTRLLWFALGTPHSACWADEFGREHRKAILALQFGRQQITAR